MTLERIYAVEYGYGLYDSNESANITKIIFKTLEVSEKYAEIFKRSKEYQEIRAEYDFSYIALMEYTIGLPDTGICIKMVDEK